MRDGAVRDRGRAITRWSAQVSVSDRSHGVLRLDVVEPIRVETSLGGTTWLSVIVSFSSLNDAGEVLEDRNLLKHDRNVIGRTL